MNISVEPMTPSSVVETAFDVLPRAALVVDREAQIVYRNSLAKHEWHWPGEAPPPNLDDLFVGNRKELRTEIIACASGGIIVLRKRGDDTAEALRFEVAALRQQDGRPKHFVLLQDLSQRGKRAFAHMNAELKAANAEGAEVRRHNLKLRQQQDALAEANRQLADLNAALQRSNRELDDFAHITSHDLREPIRGVAINAKLLLKEHLSPAVEKRLNRILVLCDRMDRLNVDLLQYAKLTTQTNVAAVTDPGPVLRDIRQSLTEMLTDRSATLEVATELPTVALAVPQTKTVFQNLIVNGLKYNRSLRKIVRVGFAKTAMLRGTPVNDVFFVEDNGTGIEDRNRESVFKMFNRLHSDAAFGEGTGAGLAFVKKIAETSGGWVDFQSPPDGGTIFYVALPLASPEATSEANPP
ncbi:sensor histidine kinase [Tritonibacter horizontis]|uniref:histidine kinase n=1 Tax=Tritonibacter horizontis TaxID=1768241 RepID=A0A132BQ93_9RHOB|nr:ATP-binding protein [Tritonibacter horizontis]KUP90561.1 phytochrome-like protein cph1 [Tritonibacter horizontis]